MSSLAGKAWGDVIDSPIGGRLSKPRSEGITMVLDKGLGLAETKDLLDLAADYVDYIKLAFGTSALYSEELLRRKMELTRSYGVDIYPGGTFFEIAIAQGRFKEYLHRASELGFNCVEISEGTINLDKAVKRSSIAEASKAGFRVITEVGKKDTSINVTDDELSEGALDDLQSGAWKVIIEGRESGKSVGIFDSSGSIREGSLEHITGALSMQDIIWEAPLKSQQESLIIDFGPNVNLGNIPTSDVVALEALRLGLRGDTLKHALKMG